MEKILAIDLSSKSTGWATKVNNELQYGCITSSSTDKMIRIKAMRDNLLKVIKEYDIEKIILEEVRPETYDKDEEDLYSHLRNPATAKLLYWLQGIIVFTAYEYNKKIDFEFIMPNSWRSKIGIKTGKGIKRDVLKLKDIEYVKNKYNITVNDDIADAIGILDSYTCPQEKPKKDLSAFEGFDFK